MDDKFVVNLSNVSLTKDQISVLSKGLNFCPSPGENDPGLLRADLDSFHKRLRLSARFNDEDELTPSQAPVYSAITHDTEPFKHRKFKMPSSFNPQGPTNLEAMILANEHALNHRCVQQYPVRDNLTHGERLAIQQLKNNNNIVILPADKGSAVVVQNLTDYLKEGKKQLSNEAFYQEMDSDLTANHNREITSFLGQMLDNGEIDITVFLYLVNKEPRTANMYLLPKIHKGVTPPPGRPICSANGSPTEKISQLVDHFLNPPTTKLKSYVKDTTHFLKIIKEFGPLPPNCFLVTLDVTSLYTNIPNDEGLQAAKETLEANRPDPKLFPSNKSLFRLLDFVLTMNNFKFNGKHYLQKGGTAMGTKTAPSYANNAMGRFERLFVYTYHKQPLLWLRYIDDCFCIFQGTEAELQDFIVHLNSCSPSIKFTAEFSRDSVNFLDTTITIQDRMLVSDLYCKPTDSHNYLQYTSAHPKRCRDSIPYSQFLRIRRICSNLKDFDKHVIVFSKHFQRRGYPTHLLQEAALKARRLNRDTLLSPGPTTQDDSNNSAIVVSTYHPQDSTLTQIVKNN